MKSWLTWARGATACMLVILSAGPGVSAADYEILFPPGSNVFNVVTDGGLDNTGATDVTAKFQALLDERGRSLSILYFPKGTYLVSDAVAMKYDISRTPESHSHGPYIIGESRSETIIRLKDGTWPKPDQDFLSASEAAKGKKKIYPWKIRQCVLSTGDCTNTTFSKILRNFTINTGKNNAGAVGLQYNTSNKGLMTAITIVSEDGKGAAGLALAGTENGPGGFRDIRIAGFDIGIYGNTYYVFGCSDIEITDARLCGIMNIGFLACENVRITMTGTGPAIRNTETFSLIGGQLKGGAAGQVAIDNQKGGRLYARTITAEGFTDVLPKSGATLDEFVSGESKSLFGKATTALRLPIVATPEIPYEKDPAKWANPMDYGAVGDGIADDTEAVQKALSDPTKTHVVFPYSGKPAREDERHKVPDHTGRWFRVTKPLVLGPTISRVIGTAGRIACTYEDRVTFTIGDGSAPAVALEMMDLPPIHIETSRPVVISSVSAGWNFQSMGEVRGEPAFTGIYAEGTGHLFIEDTHGGLLVNNPKQQVWLRHYNSELGGWALYPAMTVRAGSAWILGWKSEGLGERIRIEAKGAAELTGFNNYSQARGALKFEVPPLFVIEDGRFSSNNLAQEGIRSNPTIVKETRNGVTKTLNGRDLGLYSGFPAP